MPNPAENQTPQSEEYKVNNMFSVPDFTVPYPDNVNEMVNPENTIFNWGGVKIARISPEVVVKFGSHVTLIEARSMIFVDQNTQTLSVPKVFAYYTYGPIRRDVEDYGSLFNTYIFMSFVEGQSLDKSWEAYDEVTKNSVTNQLRKYLYELRTIRGGTYIGSVDSGPVTDPVLETYHVKGPFDSEEAFNDTLVDAYQSRAPKRQIKKFLSGMLSQNRHRIVFTHGDFRLPNIMVRDGSVTGIVDWEFSGWFPEYWEFAKALNVWRWQNDWTDYLTHILQPYFSEYAVHSFLTETLW